MQTINPYDTAVLDVLRERHAIRLATVEHQRRYPGWWAAPYRAPWGTEYEEWCAIHERTRKNDAALDRLAEQAVQV